MESYHHFISNMCSVVDVVIAVLLESGVIKYRRLPPKSGGRQLQEGRKIVSDDVKELKEVSFCKGPHTATIVPCTQI